MTKRKGGVIYLITGGENTGKYLKAPYVMQTQERLEQGKIFGYYYQDATCQVKHQTAGQTTDKGLLNSINLRQVGFYD